VRRMLGMLTVLMGFQNELVSHAQP